MWSFKYPDQLLHRTMEKEWFPPSKEETKSSLDALERQEEDYETRMHQIAQAPAKQPIGLSSKSTKPPPSSVSQLDVSIDQQSRPRFWNVRRYPRNEAQSMALNASSLGDSSTMSPL